MPVSSTPVRDRLIAAAMECFLNDDYHKVTTRQIAAAARTNISMIRYYFRSKEGLYEEMMRQTMEPLLDVLDQGILSSRAGFADYFNLYYTTMAANPSFPVLILKVLALNEAPGKRFFHRFLERGRAKARDKIEELQARGVVDEDMSHDIVRIAFVSLAMMPMLLKNVFEVQMGQRLDAAFLDELARFNGRLFETGLLPASGEPFGAR